MESTAIYSSLKSVYQEKKALLVSALNEIDNDITKPDSDRDNEALKNLDQAAFHYQKAKEDYNNFLQSFVK